MPRVDAPAEQAITHEGCIVGHIWYLSGPKGWDHWMARTPVGEIGECYPRDAAIAWLMEQHAKSLVKEGE